MAATSSLAFTDRDSALLETLTHRVRVLSIQQVGRTWWADTRTPSANACSRLKDLEQRGLVTLFESAVHPELDLPVPLLAWAPGAPPPELGPLAYRLETRWTKPHLRTLLVTATKACAARLGGYGGRRPRATEVSHDVGVATLYLQLAKHSEPRAQAWVSEAALASEGWGKGSPLPDAALRDGGGETLIEFAGSYPKDKLEGFHQFCAAAGFAYEVW